MEQTHDYTHFYGAANNLEASVRVRVFEGGDDPSGEVRAVVLMSDDGHRGPSITNNVEIVAAEVSRDRGLDPEATAFIEHYPRSRSDLRAGLREEFDLVRFARHDPEGERRRSFAGIYRFGTPAWASYGREAVQRLIGRELPDERIAEEAREPQEAAPQPVREFSDGYLGDKPYWSEGIVLTRVRSDHPDVRRIGKTTYTNVPNLVTHHSPSGFDWAYGGSGPADLALNICELAVRDLGVGRDADRVDCFDGDCYREAWTLHRGLKRELIATVPERGGVIPWERVTAYVTETLNLEERV